jgi:hypothetical protein
MGETLTAMLLLGTRDVCAPMFPVPPVEKIRAINSLARERRLRLQVNRQSVLSPMADEAVGTLHTFSTEKGSFSPSCSARHIKLSLFRLTL